MNSPCWLKSRPTASCSAVTRIGRIQFVSLKSTSDPTKLNALTISSASMWYVNVFVCPQSNPTSRASTPVSTIPTMPPTPWQGNTSSVSSSVERDFQCTARLLTMLAVNPMKMLWGMLTKPAAGVIATRPTTAPMHAPSADGLRPRAVSNSIHDADAMCVVANARPAVALADNAEPALNPNHPNQSIPVPSST